MNAGAGAAEDARGPNMGGSDRAPADWNVIVTLAEPTFREARRLMSNWGKLRTTGYHNVLVMTVADPSDFVREFAAMVKESPGLLNDVSHVIPFEACFDFADLESFEAGARAIALGWLPRLANKAFHVRLHRRGLRDTISTPAEERFLDDVLLQALEAAGTPGRMAFDDPDAVLLIETVGGRAGLALWTREEIRRYRFLGVD